MKMHLVTGGSGSGKSAYAEQLLVASGQGGASSENSYLYIATMKPYGAETLRKIERHHKLRAGKGFITVECYEKLKDLDLPENEGILLECMSNLTANELYEENGAMREGSEVLSRILDGIANLRRQTGRLVVVTNEVSADANAYSKETREYQKILGILNQELGRMADSVTEVVYGIPVAIKE